MRVLSFGWRRVSPAPQTGAMDSVDPAGLSRAEINKDTAQSVTEAAATMVGEVASIVTGAVKGVASSVGGFASEVFEIRESARRARADRDEPAAD